jgi:hypothetical protein
MSFSPQFLHVARKDPSYFSFLYSPDDLASIISAFRESNAVEKVTKKILLLLAYCAARLPQWEAGVARRLNHAWRESEHVVDRHLTS